MTEPTAPALPPLPEQDGSETLLVEQAGSTLVLTMNRPDKKNAISVEMAREMVEVFDALETDARCQVVVLTGAGDRVQADAIMGSIYGPPARLPTRRSRLGGTSV